MLDSDTVEPSENGKAELRKELKDKNLSQNQLAEKAGVSEDTVKRLLGTKKCPNGVERWSVKNIANFLGISPIKLVNPSSWYHELQLPPEFELLIRDRTTTFYGREFVFDEIENFVSNNPNGYFTVVGDPGMGKTAIAAKYIIDHPRTICFFNIRAEGINRPDLFLRIVRQQLIQRYNLQKLDDADFSTLLTKVSEKLTPYERIVIVVDALDEVNQEPSGNLLFLPYILPKQIYFFLTRRPYEQAEKRLHFSPITPTKELDLSKYPTDNYRNVKEYIAGFLNEEKYQDAMNQWIQKQEYPSKDNFINVIAKKSESNFMYLRHVLPQIANGFYNTGNLETLPTGLQEYYYNHWQIMGMTNKHLRSGKIKIIYAMSALRRAASRGIIAKYSKQNEMTVQEVLDGWTEFLHKQENIQPIRYRFYHESFINFLHRQDIVQAAGISLPNISGELAEVMTEGLFDDE